MITLSNNKLIVEINEKGAELQSICYNNTEYLWQADAKYWGKHAPVLFPIVGELKDGKFSYDGCDYSLSRHGFARDKNFEVRDATSTSVLLTLKNDEESLKIYPFMFIFQVRFDIKGNTLMCKYIVQNTDVKTILFSVGGHPAFRVPLNSDLKYEDYFLKFNNDNVLKRYVLKDGLVTDETEKIYLNDQSLPLQHSLFYKDAIVLKDLTSNEIDITTKKDTHGIKFRFEEFPYFGIWAAKDADFVCLEPWCGIADNIHHNNLLINKEGINELTAGDRWERTWSIELS